MSRIEVEYNSRTVERALGEVMSARVRRKAVAEAGSSARKDLIPMIAEIYGTSRAGLGARAKSPAPGSRDPMYVIRMNRRLRLAKLKAGNRRFTRKRGATAGLLKVVQPQAGGTSGQDWFHAAKGEQRGEFILKARGGRKQRKVGGPIIRRELDTTPALKARVDQIPQDVSEALARQIKAVLSRKGRR